ELGEDPTTLVASERSWLLAEDILPQELASSHLCEDATLSCSDFAECERQPSKPMVFELSPGSTVISARVLFRVTRAKVAGELLEVYG
ncbi:hypothetical protein ACH5RR_032495, partial [Cinchona calisaya]